jgi:hypothetical protein
MLTLPLLLVEIHGVQIRDEYRSPQLRGFGVNDLRTGRNGADDLDGGAGASVTTVEKT